MNRQALQGDFAQELRSSRRLWIGFAVLCTALAAAAFLAAEDIGRSRAIAASQARAEDARILAIAILRGELEKQRALPLILSRDPDVRGALAEGDKSALNVKLEDIARETRAAVIYLLNQDGIAIAASNWREPTSFVGNDYAFRDYFTGAAAHGGAEQFALGTVSNRPGLYITRRIENDGKTKGVIVVKVEFDQVEEDWRALGGATYVTDARGVVLISTVPGWRFRVESPLAADAAEEIRRSLQFGAAPLEPLPIEPQGEVARVSGDARGLYIASRTEAPTTSWRLNVLLPVDAAVRKARADLQALAALVLMPGAALGALLLRRSRKTQSRRRDDARAKALLEHRVAERTSELAGANARLVEEMAERAQAQERLSDAREELAKANRLATLGQIAAGVAHEINQPLSAIRAYAENARAFLDRNEPHAVDVNLGTVVSLTERIGHITETLRGFARRGQGPLAPVALADAIAGALMILDAPLRQAGVAPHIDEHAGLAVLARRIELEQVLVNLLRNAIEALDANPRPNQSPRLAIDIVATQETVNVMIIDNGPGLDPTIADALFTPFSTSKPRGLGLGLVICRDIVTSFGGALSVTSRPDEGCVFTIALKRAA